MNRETSTPSRERLATYHRVLVELLEGGSAAASSVLLARRAEVTPAQVRRDLACLGHFGKRGYGYDLAYLAERIQYLLDSHAG